MTEHDPMDSIGMTSGPLTMENIEAAMKASLENFGTPEFMSFESSSPVYAAIKALVESGESSGNISIRRVPADLTPEDYQAATDFLKQLREL